MTVAFFGVEGGHAEPLLDVRLLSHRPRIGGLVVMALTVGVSSFVNGAEIFADGGQTQV